MPRYFMHVCNGMGFAEDPEGVDLPDLEAAREKAIEGLRDPMAGEMKAGQLNAASFVEQRIQMLSEIWQQTHSEAPHRTTRLVTRLVLIESPVRVTGGLTNVQAPGLMPSLVMQQDDVD